MADAAVLADRQTDLRFPVRPERHKPLKTPSPPTHPDFGTGKAQGGGGGAWDPLGSTSDNPGGEQGDGPHLAPSPGWDKAKTLCDGQGLEETHEKKKRVSGTWAEGLANFKMPFYFILFPLVLFVQTDSFFGPPPGVSLCTVLSPPIQNDALLRSSPAQSQNFRKLRIKVTIIH